MRPAVGEGIASPVLAMLMSLFSSNSDSGFQFCDHLPGNNANRTFSFPKSHTSRSVCHQDQDWNIGRRWRRHSAGYLRLLAYDGLRSLRDLCRRDLHPRFETPGVHHLPVHIELLVFRDLELLVRSVVQRQDHREGWYYVEHLPRYCVNLCDRCWGGSGGNGLLQFHAHVDVMNTNLFAVDSGRGTIRDIDVPDCPVVHLEDEV